MDSTVTSLTLKKSYLLFGIANPYSTNKNELALSP